MRVIFLDIDGELTYTGYRNEKTQDIDLEKVALLKEIVETTDAKIVLSSSWKCGYDKTTGEKKSFIGLWKIYYLLWDYLYMILQRIFLE